MPQLNFAVVREIFTNHDGGFSATCQKLTNIFCSTVEELMSFWKHLVAGLAESAARSGDRQRNHAQKILDSRGDKLTEEQRAKVEIYAYGDQPEQLREFAGKLRDD